MQIVENVKIGYREFKVVKTNSPIIEDDKVYYGNIYFDTGTINLSTCNYSEDQQKCTFIHECLHGIDEITESGLTEDQVRKMAKGLYAFIKDNPNVFSEDNQGTDRKFNIKDNLGNTLAEVTDEEWYKKNS